MRTVRYNVRIFGASLFFLLAFFLVFQAEQAMAADTVMEIFFLPHRPAVAVVNEVEKVATEFDGMVIKKYSFDDPASARLVKKYNLTTHMPVAIFINGQNRFTVDGHKISLRNFPKGNSFVPMFAGEWDYADLRAILKEVSGEK
jgi:hypothetical protein